MKPSYTDVAIKYARWSQHCFSSPVDTGKALPSAASMSAIRICAARTRHHGVGCMHSTCRKEQTPNFTSPEPSLQRYPITLVDLDTAATDSPSLGTMPHASCPVATNSCCTSISVCDDHLLFWAGPQAQNVTQLEVLPRNRILEFMLSNSCQQQGIAERSGVGSHRQAYHRVLAAAAFFFSALARIACVWLERTLIERGFGSKSIMMNLHTSDR